MFGGGTVTLHTDLTCLITHPLQRGRKASLVLYTVVSGPIQKIRNNNSISLSSRTLWLHESRKIIQIYLLLKQITTLCFPVNIQENYIFLIYFQIIPNRQRKHTYFKFTIYHQQFNPGTDLFQNSLSQMKQELNEHIKNWVTASFQILACFVECTMFDNSIWRILCVCVHVCIHFSKCSRE